jgi:cobalt-precorrin-5B (C1)-methyltransferase
MTRLRTGFSTGAYAAATALAAWRCLCGRRNGRRIGLRFPDGKTRRVNVDGWEAADGAARAWARKDAGDDIDITDGAIVRSCLSRIGKHAIRSADHCVPCGKARLVLRAGTGVGVSTRAGLDVPPGKWAINPAPRRMIADNLLRAGLGDREGTWLVELAIDNGVALARKTLNPVLGIRDGLSVLGTSGIVVPCSNAAYIRTIRVLLKGARETGTGTAVLVTGGRTHEAARHAYPGLPEGAFVRIGDFIREACECARGAGYERLIVCCMPGKLAKYALGHAYTHAHQVAMSVPRVLVLLRQRGVIDDRSLTSLRDAESIRECLDRMTPALRLRCLRSLGNQARCVLAGWAPDMRIDLRVLGFDGSKWLI